MWLEPRLPPKTTPEPPGILLSLVHPSELEGFSGIPFPHVVDLKNPAEGSLGMPAPPHIREVASSLPDGVTFSVAIGDAVNDPPLYAHRAVLAASQGAEIVKTGLFDFPGGKGVEEFLSELNNGLKKASPVSDLVAAVYADRSGIGYALKAAGAAARAGASGILVDTYGKEGGSLFDFWSLKDLETLNQSCREQGLFFAIAGSLSASHLEAVMDIGPRFAGFRSAVAKGARGERGIDPQKVMELYRRAGYGEGGCSGALSTSGFSAAGEGASRSRAGRVAR